MSYAQTYPGPDLLACAKFGPSVSARVKSYGRVAGWALMLFSVSISARTSCSTVDGAGGVEVGRGCVVL